jgi:hypothetical protein
MEQAAPGAGVVAMTILIVLAFCVFYVAVGWKLFVKAGKPGWAFLVPIYNLIVMLEICGRPLWWIVLFFIPLVSIIPSIIICIDFVKRFGKGTGYGIAFIFFSFILAPILAFGDAKYTPLPAKA